MRFEVASEEFISVSKQTLSQPRSYQQLASETLQREGARMKALDSLLTLQQAVGDLEVKLEIDKRWEPEDREWIETARKIRLRDFQQACNKLEGLVVSRCMEFTKIHQSQLGKYFHSVFILFILTWPNPHRREVTQADKRRNKIPINSH